jgi:hypothetical protein
MGIVVFETLGYASSSIIVLTRWDIKRLVFQLTKADASIPRSAESQNLLERVRIRVLFSAVLSKVLFELPV